MITTLVRRLRFTAGSLALLGLLAFVATLLMTAAPRLSNAYADAGLRERVGRAAYQVRDLTFSLEPDIQAPRPRPVEVPAATFLFEQKLEPQLRDLIVAKWSAQQVGPEGLAPVAADGTALGEVPLRLGLRTQSGAAEAVDLVEGQWPGRNLIAGAPIEVALAETVADRLGLSVGMTFGLTAPADRQLPVTIVGLFRPLDPRAPIWEPEPEVITPFTPIGEDGVPWRGVLITDDTGIAAALALGIQPTYEWRFRFDEQRLTTANLDSVVSGAIAARHTVGVEGARSQTELDGLLTRFAGEVAGVAAILAVVQAGVLATVFGLALLAARGLVERRRTEAALLRARGASLRRLGGRLALEVGLVVPVAVAAAWLFGRTLTGRPGPNDWLAVLLGLATVLAVPVIAGASQRTVSFVGSGDMVRPRRSMRRVTGEASVLVLAGVGALVLNQRGLDPQRGVDGFVVCVPVLLAAAVALVALRLLPWPLRQMGRLTARSRGSVAFLGFARAGRASSAGTGPLVVLVVAVSTAIFSAVVASTITDGRDRATDQAVPGDILVEGFLFTPDAAQRLAAVAGVSEVATLSRNPASPLASSAETDATALEQVYAATVDGPALARVLAQSGRTDTLPPGFADAARTSGPAPAVVSPRVAADLGANGSVEIQGVSYAFTVATVVDTFPGVPIGASRFVVLPQQAVEPVPGKPILPTAFVVAGVNADLAGLRKAGDDSQRDWKMSVTGAEDAQAATPTLTTTWVQHRMALETSGVNRLLAFAFLVGAGGGLATALLAVGFAVVAGARARGRTLSRLRTMGLSRRQGNRLLGYELLPVLVVGAAAGTGVGLALPTVLAGVLDLSAFTGGFAVRPRLDPVVTAAVAALVLVAMVAALLLEQLVNRRLRLGDVLRLGEEMS